MTFNRILSFLFLGGLGVVFTWIIRNSEPDVIYNNLLIGFFASIFGSVMFLVGLWLLKPRLEISKHIAKNDFVDKKTAYWFKVVNKTLFFKVIDIQAKLTILSEFNVDGGTNVMSTEIELKRDRVWYINPVTTLDDRVKGSYAFLFRTLEDIDTMWSSEKEKLQLQIMCKHAFSGFSQVFKRTYFMKRSCIKEGSFRFGNSFDIV